MFPEQVKAKNFKIISQWDDKFKSDIDEFKIANAICGYVSPAIVKILSNMKPNFK